MIKSLATLVGFKQIFLPLYFVFVRSPCCPNSARPAVPTSILHEAKLQKSAFFCNNDSSAVQLAPGHRFWELPLFWTSLENYTFPILCCLHLGKPPFIENFLWNPPDPPQGPPVYEIISQKIFYLMKDGFPYDFMFKRYQVYQRNF